MVMTYIKHLLPLFLMFIWLVPTTPALANELMVRGVMFRHGACPLDSVQIPAEPSGTEEALPASQGAVPERVEETAFNQPQNASSTRVRGFELALAILIGMIAVFILHRRRCSREFQKRGCCPGPGLV